MGCGLALDGEVGGQNKLVYLVLLQTLNQLIYTQLFRAYAINRLEMAQQHKVFTLEAARLLYGVEVGRIFNHTDLCGTAAAIATDIAEVVFGQGAAATATAYMLNGL